jgi:hypothetical protein
MSDVPANNPINVTDLDKEFPVPGQDNDSQGFRDNFTVIDDNFVAAKARLEDLETNSVRKEANTTFLPLSTGGTARLINPTLQSHSEVKYEVTVESGTATIDFSQGTYQTIIITDDTEVTFTNVPDSGYMQKVVLHITATGGTQNLTWDDSLTIKFDTASESFWNRTTTQSSDIPINKAYLIEVWTYQGSTTFYANYIGEFE